ncbi:MAG TPA: 50S ribosomal protein L10 [Acidimicrobiales bacterium]
MAARTGTAEPRPEKVAVVTEVRQHLSSSNGALLTEYRGLKVADLARLRQALRDSGGEYRIYKNTLVRLAAVDLGLDDLVALLEGPTAIAFVRGDPVAVAKSLRDFAKTNPHLTVKGGLLGTKVLTAAEATALADVAPREVVLAQLAGALAAPLVKMAGLLQALPRNFAYGLKALLDLKAEGAPLPEAAKTEAPVDEAPAAEAEAPAAEAPVADAPVDEAPATETAAVEAPVDEAPAAEAPEAPVTEVPAAEATEATEATEAEPPATEAEAPVAEADAPPAEAEVPETTAEAPEVAAEAEAPATADIESTDTTETTPPEETQES